MPIGERFNPTKHRFVSSDERLRLKGYLVHLQGTGQRVIKTRRPVGV